MTKTNHQTLGVCAILINEKSEILIGKRKNSYKAGYYGFPGGRVDINEPLLEAIKREIFEETNLEINNFEFVGVVRENQGEYDFIHFVYVAKNILQTPKLNEPEKCEGWEWILPEKIPSKLLLGHHAALKMYNAKLNQADLTT